MPTSRRRHFGSVRKLPSGRYQVRYWQGEASHTAPETFKAKADALAWLSTTEADVLRGSWIAPDAGKVTFATHAKTWLERQHHLRPRTVELYAYLLKCHILPTFGERPLPDISPTDIIAWHRALFLKLPGTAPKAYRLVAQLMRAAVEDERVLRNPCTVKGASSEGRAEQAIATVAEVEALSRGRARAVPSDGTGGGLV